MLAKIKKQQAELERIHKLAGLKKIKVWRKDKRTRVLSDLEGQKRRLITMIVLDSYLQIDNKMGILITNFFFNHCQKIDKVVQKITSSSEFKVFQSSILNEMPFMRKISTLKKIIDVPKYITADINRINDLRNAIAHSLIPETLENDRTSYKRKSIFSIEGVETLDKDTEKIMSFLQNHFVQAFEENKK